MVCGHRIIQWDANKSQPFPFKAQAGGLKEGYAESIENIDSDETQARKALFNHDNRTPR